MGNTVDGFTKVKGSRGERYMKDGQFIKADTVPDAVKEALAAGETVDLEKEFAEATKPAAPQLPQTIEVPADFFQKFEEMQRTLATLTANPQPQGAFIGAGGAPIGVQQKYPVSASAYPNPTEDLASEPYLQRFAFKQNYLLEWDVQGLTYETKFGTHVSEPIFAITLLRVIFDDEGNDTGRRIVVKKGTFTESEMGAQQIADNLGIDTSVIPLRDLLNQMRYERFKQWLLAIFKPDKIFEPFDREEETVIDGQVVVIRNTSKLA